MSSESAVRARHPSGKFLRHFFVDDRDAARVFVFRFGRCEIATTQKTDADCIEVTRCDRGEKSISAWIRRFRIRFVATGASLAGIIRRVFVRLPYGTIVESAAARDVCAMSGMPLVGIWIQ